MSNILAFDLGNEFGWAIKQSATIDSGWERLTKGKCDPGIKFHNFDYWLQEQSDLNISSIYYEDVRRHTGLFAARAYGGYLAILQMWAHKRNIKCEGVGVKTIKKFWTGNGSATKEMMIQGANERGFDVINDNEVDALALLHYVIDNKV